MTPAACVTLAAFGAVAIVGMFSIGFLFARQDDRRLEQERLDQHTESD